MSLRHITAGMFMALVGVLVLGGSGAQGAHPGANGKIAFPGSGLSGLWSISSDGTDRTRLLLYGADWDWYPAFDAFRPAWSPDGARLAFNGYPGGNHPDRLECYDEGIWSVSADSGEVENLYCPQGGGGPPGNPQIVPYAMSWSPDGSKIVLDDAQRALGQGAWAERVSVVDVATGVQSTLVQAYVTDPAPLCPAGTYSEAVAGGAWSPLGDRIAFVRDATVDSPPYECPAMDGIWTIAPNGSGLTQITIGDHGAPDWSPDGSKIVFVAVDDPYGRNWLPLPGAIYVVDTNGGTPTLLRGGSNVSPIWSPDGTKIAFVSISGSDREIVVMNADGSNPQSVPNTSDVQSDGGISWQPTVSSDPDGDDDGVDDSIQTGTGSFDDGSGTSGSITDANGLDVLVSDADDSGDGVKITVTGSSAVKASFTICGFPIKIAGGSEIVITCGSVTVEVVEGAAEIELGDGVVVSVPEGGTARVTDEGGTFFSVENLGSTDVTVTVDGTTTIVPAGETISVSSDVTDPTVTCNPASFLLNQPGALVTATVSDGESGPAANPLSAPADTSSPGSHSVQVTGSDEAGNSTTASCGYSVRYSFSGFFQPVDNPPTVNSAKAGQPVPVKWRITDYFGAGIDDPASFSSITSGSITCDSGDPQDAIETYAGNSGLQYLGNGNWQFNWATSKSYAGKCRVMRLNLADGASDRSAEFRFK